MSETRRYKTALACRCAWCGVPEGEWRNADWVHPYFISECARCKRYSLIHLQVQLKPAMCQTRHYRIDVAKANALVARLPQERWTIADYIACTMR